NLGIISGTPIQAGTYPFIARVVDAGSRIGTVSFSITIATTGFAITTTSLKDPISGISYSQSIVATNGTAPLTWSIVAGALPTGLSIDPNSGSISGKTTAAGTASFTVQAKDSTGAIAQRRYSVVVDAAALSATAAPQYAVRGQSLTFTTISGGRAPYA